MSSRDKHRIFRALVRRQGRICFYCDKDLVVACLDLNEEVQPDLDPRPIATIDHLKPRAAGGTNRISNLVLCCRPCHRERHGQ